MAGTVPSLPPDAQRYIAALEKRLEQAEKSLLLLPHQKGPLPGWLRSGTVEASRIIASLIQGPQPVPAGAGQLTIDTTGSTPGSSPLIQVTDPNGVVRAVLGNLAANGVSPAQWGFRANDASGNPIFDSLGLIGVAKNIAEVVNINAVQGNNLAFADVSGAVTPSFTLARTSNLLVMAMGSWAAQVAGAGNVCFLGLRCGPNTTTGAPMRVDAAVPGFVPYSVFFFTTLGAGTYTAALQAHSSSNTGGDQWNVAYADVAVLQMGT